MGGKNLPFQESMDSAEVKRRGAQSEASGNATTGDDLSNIHDAGMRDEIDGVGA